MAARDSALTALVRADHDGSDELGLQLIKTQDTIPIHSAVMSQKIAINSLEYGEDYTVDKIGTLKPNRDQLLDALSPLGTLGKGVWGGDAIYFFARLPKGMPLPLTYSTALNCLSFLCTNSQLLKSWPS